MLTHKRNSYLFLLLFIVACSVEKAIIPSYVFVKKMKLVTNLATQGDTSQDIQDVWLFQNGEFKGSFGLPTYIPIIDKAKQNIELRAGVRRSGQDDQRLNYPLFTSFDTILPFSDLRSDTITPRVTYLDNCKFSLIQDFDGSVNFFSIKNPKKGDTIINVSNSDAWKLNNNSCKLVLSDSTYELFYVSKELSNLPSNGVANYLEVDYRCNDVFDIGLNVIYANGKDNSTYGVISANPTNGLWKKVYLDLATEISSEIAQNGINTKFQIFFRVKKSGNPIMDNTYLFLDNIKLIHF
jgi:hypothetical protein